MSIDWRIVAFAIGVSTASGVLFGLVPSLIGAVTSSDVDSKSLTGWRTLSSRSPQAWLIAAEVAVSVVLLAAGSLLFHSLVKLQHVDSGLTVRNILTFHFRVMSPHDVVRFSQTMEGIRKLPGVRSVSATSFLPFDVAAGTTTVSVRGHAKVQPGQERTVTVRTIMLEYFRTMGIPIRRGREFKDDDNLPQAPMRFVVK